jgi:hypothetical protein|tara:strand:+ start:1433 stop:2008 length:576 start_codon:yes stop_codon:yes gene_type:complete
MTKKSVFETLSNIEINPDNIEKKGKFNYISWAAAWQDVSQKYPDATFAKRLSEVNGFVEVDVTIEGKTLTEQFPILNYSNKPVQNPNAFDINTAFQRGLVKCLAYFGYGLFIYKGEDIPTINEINEKIEDVKYEDIEEQNTFEGLQVRISNLTQEDFDNQKDEIRDEMKSLSKEHRNQISNQIKLKGFLTA